MGIRAAGIEATGAIVALTSDANVPAPPVLCIALELDAAGIEVAGANVAVPLVVVNVPPPPALCAPLEADAAEINDCEGAARLAAGVSADCCLKIKF